MSSRRLGCALGLVTSLLIAGTSAARAGEPGEATPWLGVAIAPGPRGTKVIGVYDGSPAEAAGVRVGDQIVAVDGTPTPDPDSLRTAVHAAGVGTTVTLRALGTDGTTRKIAVRLDVMPSVEALIEGALLDKAAPAFVFGKTMSTAGAPVTLAGMKGDVVLVDFWATWCGYCVRTLPTVESWYRRYGGQGLRVVGVTDEDLATAVGFTRRFGVTYVVASDADHAAMDAYRVTVLPMMVVIDRDGVVRRVGLGGGADELAATQASIERLLGRK